MSKATAKPSPKRLQLEAGQRYGRLVAVEFSEIRNQESYWKFQCDCGAAHITRATSVRSGRTKSCGCLYKTEKPNCQKTWHGRTNTKEYNAWQHMRQRCDGVGTNSHWYHQRGIKVCERWNESFEAFLADMGECPDKRMSLDRINNDGHYEPGNCRWATCKEQQRNTRRTRKVTTPSGEMVLADAAQLYGIDHSLIIRRIRQGWPTADVFRKPRPSIRRP